MIIFLYSPGFFTFILPLIIDSILNRAFPFVFGPNTISLLQNEKLSFTRVLRKKRLDRLLQFALFSGIVSGAYQIFQHSIKLSQILVCKLLEISNNTFLKKIL